MNIVSIEGSKKTGSIAIAIALRELKENLDEFIEMQGLIAKVQRERFLCLRKEGFSEEQAIKLSEKVFG
jgi:hypothetical protein